MTDPDLELAAARVLGIDARIMLGACETLTTDERSRPVYMPWAPLTDWRDTGQCLEWLYQQTDGAIDLGATVRHYGGGIQTAIVRAVVAVGGE